MLITKEAVRDQLLAYLNHRMTLAQLVDWSEDALYESELDVNDVDTLSDILAQLGLADVRDFGLSWEDCSSFLVRLGYHPKVHAVPMAA